MSLTLTAVRTNDLLTGSVEQHMDIVSRLNMRAEDIQQRCLSGHMGAVLCQT